MNIHKNQPRQYTGRPHFERDIVNNNTERLRGLMQKHRLSIKDVARIMGRKHQTVRVWHMPNSPRPIPDETLELLAVRLGRS